MGHKRVVNAQQVGRQAWGDGAVYPSPDTSWHNLKVSEETGVKT